MDLDLRPLALPKAPGLLADKLREMILRGELAAGSILPAEREIVGSSGLSRGSVREALKILETEGLIRIKTGRTGGAVVSAPQRDLLARSVEVFVRANAIKLEALLDCRLAVEPMLARLAARNRTEEELANLVRLHAEFTTSVDHVERYRLVNFEWHLVIARASRNEPLTAVMEAISTPVREATGFERFTTPATRREAVRAHEAILAAIACRDQDAAAGAMHDHLSVYTSGLPG